MVLIDFFKNTYFQKYVLSKIRTFKNTYFQKYVLSKIRVFPKDDVIGENPVFFKNTVSSHFYRIPYFFKSSVFFLKIPRSKFVLEFLTKIPCYFQKFPVQKTIDVTNSVVFSPKIPCFTKFPGFHIFKSFKKA